MERAHTDPSDPATADVSGDCQPDPHEAEVEAPPSDEVLLVRTAAGDRAAFEQLYDRFAARVLGLARRIVRDPTIAQDTTQEVMVQVWRTAPRFDPDRGSAAGWILTLTHRRAVDSVRREQALRDRQDRAAARESHRPTDDVGDRVEEREEYATVTGALDVLTDLQRESIELAYFGGRTYREVAEQLDTPLGTVKTRIRDGLHRLRQELGATT